MELSVLAVFTILKGYLEEHLEVRKVNYGSVFQRLLVFGAKARQGIMVDRAQWAELLAS